MRLPKWVVKGVKDNFDYDKLELKVKQQEAEIKSLKRRIRNLRYNSFPEEERIWVLNVYLMLGWKLFWREWEIFVDEYVKYKDEEEDTRGLEEFLPF